MNQVILILIAGMVIFWIVIILVCMKNYSKIKQGPQREIIEKGSLTWTEVRDVVKSLGDELDGKEKEKISKKLDELEQTGKLTREKRDAIEKKLFSIFDTLGKNKFSWELFPSPSLSKTETFNTPKTLEEVERLKSEGKISIEEYLRFQEKIMEEKYKI